jgi:uncharacterized damage-inducible protein DinB
MKKLTKPSYLEHAQYYEQYLDKLPADTHVLNDLKQQMAVIKFIINNHSAEQLAYRYAPAKWSVIAVLQHCLDVERIFIYRALRFARADKTPLPFFDEDEYAIQADKQHIKPKQLFKEYQTQRAATIVFFNHLTAAQLKQVGIASNANMSVRACAWIILAHTQHHLQVLKERYQINIVPPAK